jgi:hypothetical protein
VLLVAEVSPRFRAVFSFGPVHAVAVYPVEYFPFDRSDRREMELREPIRWLHGIACPVFAFEGVGGNLESLQRLAAASTNPRAHFYAVQGADHFTILDPVTRLIAQKILDDAGPTSNLSFSESELNRLRGR